MKRHQPKHIYADNRIYFITSHIHDRDFAFDQDLKRDKMLLKIFSFAWENEIELIAWSLLRNHYHLLLKISEGRGISKYISEVHRGFSFEMNQSEEKKGRSLWQNYWDWCIRDERDYWRHFNYIHNNPIKHGIVRDIDSLGTYRYSSFWNYLRTHGIEWLMDVMETYPVLDFTVNNDE